MRDGWDYVAICDVQLIDETDQAGLFLVEGEDNVEPSVPAFDPLFASNEVSGPGSFPAFSLMPP